MGLLSFFRRLRGRNQEVDAGNPQSSDPRSLQDVLDSLHQFSQSATSTDVHDQVSVKMEEALNFEPGSLVRLFDKRRPLAKADGETHQKWENQLANVVVKPLQLCQPSGLDEIGDILTDAVRNGVTVKAAGSGHSYSDVATTNDYFIDTVALRRVADEDDPILGQLKQQDLKHEWRADTMKAKWRDVKDLPDIYFDSSLEDILHVRDVFEHNTMLFETEAGIRIKDLNRALDKAGLALSNMGGYDGQSIIGAISTSTHGTGIDLPPFPDMLRSLVLATTGKWDGHVISGVASGPVNYYRIEPSNGITDAEHYKANQSQYTCNGVDIQLIQDDDCFRAVMVNMGTMGVVYSVVIEVMQLYYLTETRTVSTLDKSLALIQPNSDDADGVPEVMRRYRHFEILISPYPMRGCSVIDMDPNKPPETYYSHFETLHFQMNITPNLPKDHNDHPEKPRNFLAMLLGKLSISFEALSTLANIFPKVSPLLIKTGFAALEDRNYVAKSYKIFNLGVNGDAGFANEIGFPVESSEQNCRQRFTAQHVTKAIDSIHRVAQTARLQGEQYQTSPFAVRFVKKSPAFLSMMNGTNTSMIELDMITGTYAGIEILNRQQRALYHLGGRPHWGLEFSQLTGSHDLVHGMYPQYPKWKSVYDQLNSLGTFNNRTTIRLGFSRLDFKRDA
eukprot:scpid40801/ scgid32510/ Putative D-arabinono-1,4-lactone oxidase; L-galactono-gamma-lactone oxidase